jgi:hypothetical protein
MWRPFVYQILLFLTPFILYGLWIFIRHGIDPTRLKAWRDAPYFILLAAALVVTGLGLYAVGHFDKAPAGSKYTPARLENGVLIPPELK